MKTSETITKIAPALLAAQRNIGAAVKGSTNPFFKSKYADLGAVMEACKDALNENDIVVLQPVGMDGERTYVETILLHTSGEYISDRMLVTIVPTPVKQNSLETITTPQAQGSAITYARRYALQSLCFIPAEDDDGNSANGNHANQQPQQVRSTQNGSDEATFDVARPLPSVNMNSTHLSGLLSRDNLIAWIKYHGPLRSDGSAATYDDCARHVCKAYDDTTFDASSIAHVDRARLQNFVKTLPIQR